MQMKLFVLIMAFPVMSTFGFTPTSDHPDKGKKYQFFYKEGIVVNGNSSEWENSLFNFNKQAQVNYALVNDSSAFYVCVRIADEAEQMKVLRNGIEIRFNSKGKKKAEAMLHFPIGGRMDPGERRDRKTMHLMYLLQMQDMELSGFKSGINGFQNIKSGKNGIIAAVNWDSAYVMVYEARIPFSVFTADLHTANPIAVGIVVKGAQKPRQESGEGMQERGQGEMSGGQGQGRPGGMHPGGGSGMEGQMGQHGDNQKMFEDDEIWNLIVIAKKQ